MTTRATPLGRGRIRPAGAPTGLVGVINLTPDSFSDGGAVLGVEAAVAAARAMVDEGAVAIDVGGESTRPGATPVTAAEEIRRVIPVVRAIAERLSVPVSIDTTKAEVFVAAWDCGASILNDVSGLAADPELARAAARTDAALILMHRRGDPATMAGRADYQDVVGEVAAELAGAVQRAEAAGIPPARLILDPGIGFAKRAEHNWDLLRAVDRLRLGRFPLMVGPSRKAFLGALTGRGRPADRDVATAVLAAELARAGVELIRVHAVAAARDALLVAAALKAEAVP